MEPMLHTSPDGVQIGAPGTRRCPECLVRVEPKIGAGNMFCCAEHRIAFVNRNTVRGRQLVPIVLAARLTRDGSERMKGTGKHARRLSRSMMDKWNREDRLEGRMPADEYHALRVHLGHLDHVMFAV